MSLCSVKMQQLHLRSVKMPCSVSTFCSLTSLVSTSRSSRARAWSISWPQLERSPRAARPGRSEITASSSSARISCCSSSGKFVEVLGQAAFDLLLPVAFGVRQDLLALLLHALQATADGVDAGRQAALEHRHGEADGPAAARVFGRGLDRLVLDVARQGVVEVTLLVVRSRSRWFGPRASVKSF